jgi:hypothetical protein
LKDLEDFKAHIRKEEEERLAAIKVQQEKYEEEIRRRNALELEEMERKHQELIENEKAAAEEIMKIRRNELLRQQEEYQKKKMDEMGEVDAAAQKAILAEFQVDKEKILNNLSSEKERQNKKLEERLEQKKKVKQKQKEMELQMMLRKKQEETAKETTLISNKVEKIVNEIETRQSMASSAGSIVAAIKAKKVFRRKSQARIHEKEEAASGGSQSTDNIYALDLSLQESPRSRRARRMQNRASTVEENANSNGSIAEVMTARGPPANIMEITDKLASIERMIEQLSSSQNSRKSNDVAVSNVNGSGSSLHDPTDKAFVCEGMLVDVLESTLSEREKLRYDHAMKILSLCGMSSGKDRIILKVAISLPENENYNNTFRNSFCWEPRNRTLHIRRQRFETYGDVQLVLIHTLAHIIVDPNDVSNDNSPQFNIELFRLLRICSQGATSSSQEPQRLDFELISPSAETDINDDGSVITAATPPLRKNYFDGGSIASRLKEYSSFLKDPEVLNHIQKMEASDKMFSPTGSEGVFSDVGMSTARTYKPTASMMSMNLMSPKSAFSILEEEDSDSDGEGSKINQALQNTLEIASSKHDEEKSKAKAQLQAKLDAKKKAKKSPREEETKREEKTGHA